MVAIYQENRDAKSLPDSADGICQGCYCVGYIVLRSDETVELPSAKGSPLTYNSAGGPVRGAPAGGYAGRGARAARGAWFYNSEGNVLGLVQFVP